MLRNQLAMADANILCGNQVQVSALGERKIQLPLGFLFDMGKVERRCRRARYAVPSADILYGDIR